MRESHTCITPRVRCKHIAAVEHLLLISSEAPLGKNISVKEHELRCPECKEKKVHPGTDGTVASTKTGRGAYVDGGFKTIRALNTAFVPHSGPDAVGHGNHIGDQHPDAL